MKKFPVCAAFLLFGGILHIHPVDAYSAKVVPTSLIDSVGVEKKDGKRFILHRVDEGQTLFAIARRYGRSVADIRAANPTLKDAVKYAQIVRVPIPDGALSRKEEKVIDKAIRKQEKVEKKEAKLAEKDTSKPVTTKPADKQILKADDPAKAGIHVVEPKQTLYSLASRYGISQADIRRWNNLPGNNVLIGQALIVSEKAYQARMPSTPQPASTTKTPEPVPHRADAEAAPHVAVRPAEPRTSDPRPSTPPETKAEHPRDIASAPKPTDSENRSSAKPAEKAAEKVTEKPTEKVAEKPVEVIESPRPGNDAPMPTRGHRISNSGIAEIIDGNDGSGKYLALHRTAPIGTLVQVRNEFNNQSLWVKVIGRLPDTGVNDKILIKLSKQAFAKLSPEDRRFRAEVSYIVR
ncbi:LysM peptidoglycan-binding domain-containing protein [Spirosoma aerophilum]